MITMLQVFKGIVSLINHLYFWSINDFFKTNESFTSLGPFLRHAAKNNPDQADILFQKFGEEALKIMKKQPRTFLSTAGMGISWLHLRLDNRPKYYVSEYGYNN